MISVCIPTIKCFDLCQRAVVAFKADPMVDQVIVLDNSGGQCPEIPGAFQLMSPTNLGVAASWNWFYQHVPGELIIANDDVFIKQMGIMNLMDVVRTVPGHALYYGAMEPANMMSLFHLKRDAYNAIGPFDEKFYPAYFEDCDYWYRMTLLGLTALEVPGCAYDHEGSATLKRKDAGEQLLHHRSFTQNRARYAAKWGGLPGNERFTVPFNGLE